MALRKNTFPFHFIQDDLFLILLKELSEQPESGWKACMEALLSNDRDSLLKTGSASVDIMTNFFHCIELAPPPLLIHVYTMEHFAAPDPRLQDKVLPEFLEVACPWNKRSKHCLWDEGLHSSVCKILWIYTRSVS
jgi:hypothetical protein